MVLCRRCADDDSLKAAFASKDVMVDLLTSTSTIEGQISYTQGRAAPVSTMEWILGCPPTQRSCRETPIGRRTGLCGRTSPNVVAQTTPKGFYVIIGTWCDRRKSRNCQDKARVNGRLRFPESALAEALGPARGARLP